MNQYRKEANGFARETHWTFWRFLPLFLIVIVALSVIGFGLKSAGLLGGTIVERKVFEASYQRSEALNSQLALDQSVLVQIEHQLKNPNLDENTRFNLEAQASAARLRISTTQRKQK